LDKQGQQRAVRIYFKVTQNKNGFDKSLKELLEGFNTKTSLSIRVISSGRIVCLVVPPRKQDAVFKSEEWKDFILCAESVGNYRSCTCGWRTLCELSGVDVAKSTTPRRAAFS